MHLKSHIPSLLNNELTHYCTTKKENVCQIFWIQAKNGKDSCFWRISEKQNYKNALTWYELCTGLWLCMHSLSSYVWRANVNLPTHLCPVAIYPSKHVQKYDPSKLMHVCSHPPLSIKHSLMSETKWLSSIKFEN